jgi:hypothetical protein
MIAKVLIFLNTKKKVNLTRSKSTPGLFEASSKHMPTVVGLRRYGTLPTSLLKRTESLLFISNQPAEKPTLKTTTKASIIKKDFKIESKTNAAQQQQQQQQQQHTPLNNDAQSAMNHEKKIFIKAADEIPLEKIVHSSTPCCSSTTSSYMPTSSTLSSINANVHQLITEISENGSKVKRFKQKFIRNENDLDTNDLKREIFKLKDYIFYLEAENSSLLKEKKVKKLMYSYTVDNIELEASANHLAKPESDFDEFNNKA